MNTEEIAHQYRLQQWTEIIGECRSSGHTISPHGVPNIRLTSKVIIIGAVTEKNEENYYPKNKRFFIKPIGYHSNKTPNDGYQGVFYYDCKIMQR